MQHDPRMVIDYGKYVGPGKTKHSIGSWTAFLAVFAGLQEADSGQATGQNSYQLQSGIIAKLHGDFEHPLFGWVPVFDFVAPDKGIRYDYSRDNEMVAFYERNQAEFLKRLVCGEFEELP